MSNTAPRRWVPPDSPYAADPTALDHGIATAEPMSDAGASGARLARLTMHDGSVLVAKEISPEWDWMMPATADTGRAAELWVSGAMERCPPTVDAAIVAIDPIAGGWRIYMRDVGKHFLRRGARVSRGEARRLLSALADLHRAFWNDPPPQVARIEDLLSLVAPATLERFVPSAHPFGRDARHGWEVFGDIAPPDVRDAVEAVLAKPAVLAEALRQDGVTLTHSDPHYGNIAPLPDRFVFLDWSLAAAAPPAIDFVWYLDQSLRVIDATADELAADFAAAEGEHCDGRTLRLAYLAELVLSAWQYAVVVDGQSDEARQARRATFEWWVGAARLGLDVL